MNLEFSTPISEEGVTSFGDSGRIIDRVQSQTQRKSE